jgi:hypothetical protein
MDKIEYRAVIKFFVKEGLNSKMYYSQQNIRIIFGHQSGLTQASDSMPNLFVSGATNPSGLGPPHLRDF